MGIVVVVVWVGENSAGSSAEFSHCLHLPSIEGVVSALLSCPFCIGLVLGLVEVHSFGSGEVIVVVVVAQSPSNSCGENCSFENSADGSHCSSLL